MARMRALYLEPDAEVKSDWAAVGAATDLAAISKGSGTVGTPDITSYIESSTDNQAERFSFADITPGDGEYVSYLKVHVYATTPANHVLDFRVSYTLSGTAYPVAGATTGSIPASSSAAWYSTAKYAPRQNSGHGGDLLTDSEINALTVGLQLDEVSATASTTKVYAVVLEVGLSEMEHLDLTQGTSLPAFDLFFSKGEFVGGQTGDVYELVGYQYDPPHAEPVENPDWWTDAAIAQRQLEKVKRYGARMLRVFIGPGHGVMTDKNTVVESKFLAFERLLDQAEGFGIRLDVTATVNPSGTTRWPAPSWLVSSNEADRNTTYATLWNRLAKACAGHPAVAMMDIFNEPLLPESDIPSFNVGPSQPVAITRAGRTDEDIVDDFVDPLLAAIATWDPKPKVTSGVWLFKSTAGPLVFSFAVQEYAHTKGTIVTDHLYIVDEGHGVVNSVRDPSEALDILRTWAMTEKPVVWEESGSAGQSPLSYATMTQTWMDARSFCAGQLGQWSGATQEDMLEPGVEDTNPGHIFNALNLPPFLLFLSTMGGEFEEFTLDGLPLHDGGYQILELALDPPQKRYQRTQSRDGTRLADIPGREDRTITMKLRVLAGNQPDEAQSMDRAFDHIAAIRQKLEEADRLVTEGERGVVAVYRPSGSVRPMKVYVTGGDIQSVPKVVTGDEAGYFASTREPVFMLSLTCNPFLYGETVTVVGSSAQGPLASLTLSDVLGDVPADAEFTLREASAQDRRFVEWGMQQRNYNLTSLVLDSDGVTTTGFSGTGTTRSGAYDPGAAGNSVVRVTPTSSPLAVCGMTDQGHMGRFRVRARLFATGSQAAAIKVRLRWRVQQGPWTEGTWVDIPIYGIWCEPELASVVLPRADVPSWDWVLDAVGVGGGTDTLDFDCMGLLPVDEGYGKASAPAPSFVTSDLVANDNFNSLTPATSLNGRTAPTGGTWATSASGGSPADFVGTATQGAVSKAGNSEGPNIRRALLPTSRTTVESSALFWGQRWVDLGTGINGIASLDTGRRAVIARFVDNSNYVMLASGSGDPGVWLIAKVAGVQTYYAGLCRDPVVPAFTWVRFRLIVYDTGGVYAGVQQVSISAAGVESPGAILGQVLTFIPDCATGGALASGTCGFEAYNWDNDDNVTIVDNYYASTTPQAEAPIIGAGSRVRFGSQNAAPAERELNPGQWPRVPYRGSRFWLPPALDGYSTRLAWRARRRDLDESDADNITDSVEYQVTYTPRYVDVPQV